MGACLSIFGPSKNETEKEGKERLIGNEEQKDALEGSSYSSTSSHPSQEDATRISIHDDNADGSEAKDSQSGSINLNKTNLSDFDILKVIGEGSFGKVYLVSKKDTDNPIHGFAEQTTSEHSLFGGKIQVPIFLMFFDYQTIEEKNIMVNMHSPFIVQLKFAFQTATKLYFVMDFMQGGEMFYHIRKARYFKEDMARFYIAELVLALEYLHSHNTIYRDLKPENILLGGDGNIKICDFGLSKQGIEDGEKTKTICGTPEYLAPEILLGQAHGKEVDWYSLGCVMYEFLSGAPPFYSRDKQQMYTSRISCEIVRKPQFSENAWDLIQQLLARNPVDRINGAAEVKKHPFFETIDWELLQKKEVKPPFQPKFIDDKDLRFISNEFQKQAIQNTPYTPNVGNNADFAGFTYQEVKSVNS